MTAPIASLTDALRDAIARRFGPDVELDPARFVQRNRGDGDRGDVQVNAAFALAKQLRRNPAEIAAELAEAIEAEPFAPGEVSGKAFVNFRLRDEWLLAEIERRAAAERLLEPATTPEHVLIDFSSPNVAKEMHVGHLRTTIIGDSLARMFEARGHRVDRVSHVGDWGTQFGMLIRLIQEDALDVSTLSVAELDRLYKQAKARFDADPSFQEGARRAVVALQSGEAQARRVWEQLRDRSNDEFQAIYERLDVRVVEVGESFYQPMLAGVVSELERLGLITVDDGAKCVFLEGHSIPLIVQKADGGFNYAATDLAAVRHRVGEGADRMLYVVDHGQSQHFDMVFSVARKAGWLPDDVVCEHIPFGLVLGEDGKRLRTRSGDSIPLRSLIEEAEERGRLLAREHDAPEETGTHLGVSGLKYAELSHNRMTNYVFSFDKMVSLEGNTAPYMLYAYARINGIVERARSARAGEPRTQLGDAERGLAKLLADFEDVVDRAIAEYQPSDVTEYLFALSQEFNRFYETSRVVSGDEVDVLRLRLCEVTAATLRAGLGLLGVRTLERI
ncbi:MAG: arginine--tRNA ligase [Actinomycetota bacterium]|nr:arginine--tRNA ligase [Actinomycetota bacterium]